MKLNLLPTTEKKSRAGRTAIILGVLIVFASIGAYGAMMLISKTQLEVAKDGIDGLQKKAADADATSKYADTVIATSADVVRNAQLAQAMIDHNDVYPRLYDDVKKYIPPYYRLQSITAKALGEGQSEVRLTGTLSGYQKYADLMLALMRFKDAQTITRQGYVLDDPTVPALDSTDQQGKMRKANQPPIPDDGLERLAYFQSQAAAAPTGYLGTGGFGSGSTEQRGALPDASVVTIVMTVARDLRVPLAADTLKAAGGATAGAAPGVPGLPSGGLPGGAQRGPGGPPGAAGA